MNAVAPKQKRTGKGAILSSPLRARIEGLLESAPSCKAKVEGAYEVQSDGIVITRLHGYHVGDA